jgi:hypothetical protein
MLQLFSKVLAKFVTPLGLKLLEKMTDLMLIMLEASIPLIDRLGEYLEMLDQWWTENEDVFGQFWAMMEEGGSAVLEWFKDAYAATERLVEITGEWVKDLMEVLRFLGLVQDQSAEMAKQDEEAFQKSSMDADTIRKREEQNIKDTVARMRRMGRSEEFIEETRIRLEARIPMAIAQAQLAAIQRRQEGGRVVNPELAVIAEREPEWVIPESTAGVAKYVPKLLEKVMGKVTAVPGAAPATLPPAAAPTGQRIEQLLTEIRDLLAAIEESVEGGELPGVLYG